MSKSLLVTDTPNTCGDCPLCIYTAEEKRAIGYCNTSDEDYYCKVLERFMDQVVKAIHALPPVAPSRPKGHWISHKEHCENLGLMPSGLGAYEWCSNCDCGIDVKEFHRIHYNFCPNCRADMKESEK